MNIEGIAVNKEILLSNLCKTLRCDVLCVQKAHREEQQRRPRLKGIRLVIERPNEQNVSAIFVRPDLLIDAAAPTQETNIEIHHTE